MFLMKMGCKMKRIFALSILSVALLAFVVFNQTPAFAQDNTVNFVVNKNYYYVNSQKCDMDAVTFIENGRTYVPIRFLGEALGTKVDWDGHLAMATLTGEEKAIHLILGIKEIAVIDRPDVIDDLDEFFEATSEIDVAPLMRENRLYLPARYVAEAFGYKVAWDASTGTVTVSKNGEMVEPPVVEPPVIEPVTADPFNPPVEDYGGYPAIKVEKAQELFGPLVPPEKLIGKELTALLTVGSRDVLLNPTITWDEPNIRNIISGGTLLKNYLTVPYKERPSSYVDGRDGKTYKEDELSYPVKDMLLLAGFPEENIFWDPKTKTMVIYGKIFSRKDFYGVKKLVAGEEYNPGCLVPAPTMDNGVLVAGDGVLPALAPIFWKNAFGSGVWQADTKVLYTCD